MTTLDDLQKAIDDNGGYTPCQEAPEGFFLNDEREYSIKWSARYYDNAKALCAICPIVAICLDYAISNNEFHGVWGGVSPRERAKMKRARESAQARLKAS